MNTVTRNGIEFVEIPSGSFQMGLGTKEEAEARRLSPEPRIWWESVRPERKVSVNSFFISVSPITNTQLRMVAPKAARESKTNAEGQVARVTRQDGEKVAKRFGGRLPTEVEWEYACRGGCNGLFAFGKLPRSDKKIGDWMSWDGTKGPRNGFGLRTLYTGEWCSDTWRLSYFDESTEEPGVGVVRCGGAYFWPWQDEEWIWCMSVTRSPSTELPDTEWSFRIIMETL